MTRYYYKAKDGKGYLNLKSPLSGEELKKYTEITKAQFDKATAVTVHEPSAEEVARKEKLAQISQLKSQLAKTDYQALKYAEGWISEEDYAEIKAARQALRDQINALEAEL